ncbi:MAG: IgaA/UmoB family intracellular growth attenuator [Corticimicrobacter sp.]|uniref:IgaA/UmoB family intracellular growth attenuator n=1 Tax=Corticimicrobacter sp. TaxID=2678536 RepID=UPI0032D9F843
MDTLLILKLGLLIFVLVYSIYNYAIYRNRRRTDKHAFKDFLARSQPVRTLTAEEKPLIQPFLIHPAKPKSTARLRSDQVYILEGPHIRHGYSNSEGQSVMHDTLGGLDVVLPHDAIDFLQEHNVAEVVLTDTFAIVIRLNEAFDLIGGKARSDERERIEQKWQHGEALSSGATSHATTADGTAESDIPISENASQLIAQRDETQDEARFRTGLGFGLLASTLLFGMFLCLGIAGNADEPATRTAWLAGAGLCAALALWRWIARSRRRAKPQKVNRVRGPANLVRLVNPDNSSIVASQLFIGDSVPVNLPAHWTRHGIDLRLDGIVDADVRVDDRMIVRLNNQLSINEELQRLPMHYWGRFLTLSLASAAAVGLLWIMNGEEAGRDLALSRSLLGGKTELAYSDATQLRTALPSEGDLLALSGQARCSLLWPEDTGKSLGLDCQRLIWTDETAAPLPALDPLAVSLYEGSILQARPAHAVSSLLSLLAQAGQPLRRSASQTPYHLTRLNQTIARIDEACPFDLDVSPRLTLCAALRHSLLELLITDMPEGAEKTWDALRDYASHAGNGGILTANGLAIVQQATRDLGANLIMMEAGAPLRTIAGADRTQGVVLHVWPGLHSTLPEAPVRQDNLLEVLRFAHTQWQPDGAMPFVVRGHVVTQGDDLGRPVLYVDATQAAEDRPPALIRTATLALALALTLVFALLWAWQFILARKRERLLGTLLREQTARAPNTFF